MKDKNQLSADDIFALLSKQYDIDDDNVDEKEENKKNKFKVTKKNVEEESVDDVVIEDAKSDEKDDGEVFVSPVPKSDVEDLDVDSLFKKYLSEEDYKIATRKITEEKDLFNTFDTMETKKVEENEFENDSVDFEAPDRELFAVLSEGGKVCDIPDDNKNEGETVLANEPKKEEIAPEEEKKETIEDDETISIFDLGKIISGNTSDDISDDGDIFDAPIVPLNIVKEEPKAEKAEISKPENGNEEKIFETAEIAEAAETFIVPVESVVEDDEEDEKKAERVSTDTDTNIMLAFGLDDELDNALGKDEADKLRSANEKDSETITEEANDESKSKPKTHKELFDVYKKSFAYNAISIFGTLVVAVILFFYENIPAFGGHLADALNPDYYPTVNLMAGLQILFIGFICVLPYFVDGCKALANRQPNVNSTIPVLFAATTLYSIISCFFAAGTVYKAHFFPVAIALSLVAVSRRLDMKREKMALSIVSSKRVKYALEKLDIEGSELEKKAFDEYLPDSPAIFKINKAGLIDGFEERSAEYPSIKIFMYILCGGAIAAAIIGFVIGFIAGKSWEEAVMTAYTAFSFCIPASVFLTFSLPSFFGEKDAYSQGSAFVGEASADEYTSAASISFDDRDVFPTSGVKLFSIKMFGEEERIDNVIYYSASIYQKIGGPLSDVLNVATADIGRSENVEILSLEGNGVEAIVDGLHIFLGKGDYIRKKGFKPPVDENDVGFEGTDIAITYLVCNDDVYAKLYIRYSVDPEFENMVATLYKSGICVGIKTIDPNIDDEILSSGLKLEKYPVRVLKYASIEEKDKKTTKINSGIVSKRSAKALLKTFTLCDKVKNTTKVALVISFVAIFVGLVASSVIAFMGGVSGIYSVYVALYQLIWLVPTYIAVKLTLI